MKSLLRTGVFGLAISICLAPAGRSLDSGSKPGSRSSPVAQKDDVLLSTMQQELQRAHDSLGKLDPALYSSATRSRIRVRHSLLPAKEACSPHLLSGGDLPT